MKSFLLFFVVFATILAHANEIVFVPGWYTEKSSLADYERLLLDVYPGEKIRILTWKANSPSIKKVIENADFFAEEVAKQIKDKPKQEQIELVLIGHSMGGRVVYQTAKQLAQNNITIKQIILLGAAVDYDVDLTFLLQCSQDPVINFFSRNDSVLKYLYSNWSKKFALGFCGADLFNQDHFIQYCFVSSEPVESNLQLELAIDEVYNHFAAKYLPELKKLRNGELSPYRPQYDYSNVKLNNSFAAIPANWVLPPVSKMELLETYADWSLVRVNLESLTSAIVSIASYADSSVGGGITATRAVLSSVLSSVFSIDKEDELDSSDSVYFIIDQFGRIRMWNFYHSILKKEFDGICSQIKPIADNRTSNAQTGGNIGGLLSSVEPHAYEADKSYLYAAEHGNISSQVELGKCYYLGNKAPQNYSEAIKWFRKAADKGNADAQFLLGLCYSLGTGVEQDYKQAADMYRAAAKQDHPYAELYLGQCQLLGIGTSKDEKKAVDLIRKAANQGNTDAQICMGQCYYQGLGVKQDFNEAAIWYQKAAEKEVAFAQYALGQCYENNNNWKDAITWYNRAAEQNFAPAQVKLGTCIVQGHTNKIFSDAIEWYRKAAEQGNAEALFCLGQLCSDYSEAVKWYRLSARQGYAPAKACLAFCYETGNGVEKNIIEALVLYQEAAKQGIDLAKARYESLISEGMGTEFCPPVSISFRKSNMPFMGSTKVLQVKNLSEKAVLELTLDVYNDIKNKHFEFNLEPGKEYEVGMIEGWPFEVGEHYSLQAKGYPFAICGTVRETLPDSVETSNPSTSTGKEKKSWFATAKEEFNRLKVGYDKLDIVGSIGFLDDVLKPELVLPFALSLLDSELNHYGIDKEALIRKIETNPESFRQPVPEHSRKRFLLLQPEHEKIIGDKADAELASEGKIYHNNKDEERVRKIVERIVPQLPEPPPGRFFLYQDDTINAFCLPNGSIYINSGLLQHIKKDDELAFIIGHEYAHFSAKHGNETATKRLLLLAGDNIAESLQNQMMEDGKEQRANILRISYRGGRYLRSIFTFPKENGIRG